MSVYQQRLEQALTLALRADRDEPVARVTRLPWSVDVTAPASPQLLHGAVHRAALSQRTDDGWGSAL